VDDGATVEGDLQRVLGANLRAYRSARDLSQEGFADLLGVHRTYMGGIERGERNLTLRSVERLADRLGVTASDLLRAPADRGQPPADGGASQRASRARRHSRRRRP
jgi:transcriptional regulator with XRE-family HTH domain